MTEILVVAILIAVQTLCILGACWIKDGLGSR